MDKIVWEFLVINRFQVVQYLPQLFWNNCNIVNSHPAVKAKCSELSFQNCGSIKKYSRGVHISGQHFFRFCKEIQIMGSGIGNSQVQRISVPSSGPSDSLQVICLSRWYRAQYQ